MLDVSHSGVTVNIDSLKYDPAIIIYWCNSTPQLLIVN